MAFEGHWQLLAQNACAIVFHRNQPHAAGQEPHRDLTGACVQCVVHQLPHHGGRSLHHLTCGDLADQLIGQFSDRAAGGGGRGNVHRAYFRVTPSLKIASPGFSVPQSKRATKPCQKDLNERHLASAGGDADHPGHGVHGPAGAAGDGARRRAGFGCVHYLHRPVCGCGVCGRHVGEPGRRRSGGAVWCHPRQPGRAGVVRGGPGFVCCSVRGDDYAGCLADRLGVRPHHPGQLAPAGPDHPGEPHVRRFLGQADRRATGRCVGGRGCAGFVAAGGLAGGVVGGCCCQFAMCAGGAAAAQDPGHR